MLATMTQPEDGEKQNDEADAAKTDAPDDPPPAPTVEPPKDPLVEAKAESSKLRDQLLRTAADFDNFRKRSRREIEDAHKKGAEELLRILLPVFDNLERAVQHAEQAQSTQDASAGAESAKAIAEGVHMVLKQFTDTLGRVGIQRVAGVGEPFDPTVHEAVQQVETTDAKPGTVIAEVQRGYRMGDRLIRAAMVVVAKAASGQSKPPEAN